MNSLFLGIDTSNYTTSVSAYLTDEKFYNVKIPLCVKPNEKGVRQSDAVFMHIKNLTVALENLFDKIKGDFSNDYKIEAVGVSTRPRSVEGSYMPCFLSGVTSAKSIALSLNVPLFRFSHQEGHIRAALLGAGQPVPEHFYSFHLSGGTCELLEVYKSDSGFTETIIADSADITLGQLVDRVGVMLGISFPCGPGLEALAQTSKKKYKASIKPSEHINLSGFENKARDMMLRGEKKEDIASFVYSVITTAIEVLLSARGDKSLPVLFAGGVSGSTIIREQIAKTCTAFFAPPSLSSDNAVGIALLTKELFCKEER